jgi:hypothetical protein
MKKHYKTLGLLEGASQEEIKTAYDKLSKELDPANNDNLEFFVEEFALLQEAYKALTGKKPEEQKEADINTSDISDVFEDSDSLVSILKKFRASEDAKKLEIIKSLEAFKSNNETYQQALSMLYKKEDIKHLESATENTKSPNLKVPKESLSFQNSNDTTPKKKKDSSKKSNKTLLLILAFGILFFGAPYIYFLTKVSTFKNEIPRLVDETEYNQNSSRKIWEAKFLENHPEIVAKHIIVGAKDKGFNFKESDRKYTKDSIINFFIYSKTIPVVLYTPDFFQCVYYNAVNSDNFWNHYIVGLGKGKGNGKPLPPYLEMLKKTKKKHRVSDKEFEEFIQMVGGLKAFQQEKPSSIDDKCKKCIENYQTAFETNTVAIVDFHAFVDQYLGAKKRIGKYNRGILEKYNSKYKIQTAGMNSSMRSKLKLKIKEKPLLTSNEVTEVFSGFKEGLGDISYSFNESEEDLTPLKGYVNEIYASYYASNSLYNGATPYKYCYGASNNGYPSKVNIKSGNSDVIVTIKKEGKVYRHAYIKANSNYTFKVADGSYNVYFYYGKGWNPKKFMKNTNCGRLVGGFVSNVSVGKDMYLSLNNQYMTYTLTSVKNGNFSPKTSSINEAF